MDNIIDDVPAGVCGVYFLWHANRVIYVGQARRVRERVKAHKHMNPDAVSYISVKPQQLNRIEALFILYLNPERNRSGGVSKDICLITRRHAEACLRELGFIDFGER